MLDKLLFSVRTHLPDPGRWLGSWKLSIVLMILTGLYYGLLAIWASSSPPEVVQNIASLLPFWLLYGLLLVNTAVCLWSRLALLRRQISRGPFLTEGLPDWQIETTASSNQASKRYRDLGYEPQPMADEQLWGVRRRWAGLGTYLFHGAFAFLALGFLLTLGARREARIWVAAGEEFNGAPEQFLSQTAPRIFSLAPPSVAFRVENIRPEFWRDELLFTNLEADLALSRGARETTRINRPVWWNWSTFVRLSGFGYTPRYEIENRNGQIVDSAFAKLNVFPPGQRDYFQVPNHPHRFYVGVLPDFVERDGKPTTKSLNLTNPAILVQVWRGHMDLGGDTLALDEQFEFEGLKLGFPEIRYWGEFSIVQDPGAPVIFFGYVLGLSGLLLKLRGRRSEMTWQPVEEKRGVLKGWGSTKPESQGVTTPS